MKNQNKAQTKSNKKNLSKLIIKQKKGGDTFPPMPKV